MALLTRTELKELEQFLREVFRSESSNLVAQVRDAVKQELRTSTDQLTSRSPSTMLRSQKEQGPHLDSDVVQNEKTSLPEARQVVESEVPNASLPQLARQLATSSFPGTPVSTEAPSCRLPTLLGSVEAAEVIEFSKDSLSCCGSEDTEYEDWDTTFDKEVRISTVNVVPSTARRPSRAFERRSSVLSKGPTRFSRRSSVVSTRSDRSMKSVKTSSTDRSTDEDGNVSWPARRRLSFLSTRLDNPSSMGQPLGRAVRVLDHPLFDVVIALLIVLNGITIGVQTEYMATHITEAVPFALRVVEISFCVAFTCELLLRVLVEGQFFVYGRDWMWNMFDSIVVVLQLTEEAMGIITTATGRDRAHTNFSFMRILRVLRLIRIVRLVRVLRLIGELRTIVTSIASSMRHLFWTVMLLILMIYTVSVYFTQLVLDFRLTSSDEAATTDLSTCWSSIGRSSLTLFESIMGGIDWDVAVSPLARHISVLLAPAFCLYIAFTLLALMNVVTGVFVENAIDSANRDKERYLVQTARELFERADPNGAGVITWSEFERQLAQPALQDYLKGMGVDTVSAKGLFKILDLDNSGAIDAEELITGTLRLRGHAKAIDLAALIYESRRMSRRLQQHMRNVERRATGRTTTSKFRRCSRSSVAALRETWGSSD